MQNGYMHMGSGWEKQHKQAAARGRLVGQRRIAEKGSSWRLNWEDGRSEVRGDAR